MDTDYVTVWDDTIQQGAAWERVIFWKNPDGTAVNMRGATAELQIRPSIDSGVILLGLSTANGSLVIDEEKGTTSFSVSGIDTAKLALPFGYALPNQRTAFLGEVDFVVSLAGKTYRVLQGRIELSRGVTR